MGKIDNSALALKIAFRRIMLADMADRGIDPVIIETHGGLGCVYENCYADIETGLVFEKDETKAIELVNQRPGWAVYNSDCAMSLTQNILPDVPCTVLDVDPYGMSWAILEAFFSSERSFQSMMWLVGIDGLRSKLQSGGAWSVKFLQPYVQEYGNDLFPVYLELFPKILSDVVLKAGYIIDRFWGKYSAKLDLMVNFMARLRRTEC